MSVTQAVERLRGLLPLQQRQQALPREWAAIHRSVLRSLAERGRAPGRAEIAHRLGDGDVDALLARLGEDDLVVPDATGREIAGAYPMTTEATAHCLRVNGQAVNAMCAVDALSVAPMFDAQVEIDSQCHVSATPLQIRQSGSRLLENAPSADIRVGVRWQDPQACAAHSLCMEMVFLRDAEIACQWQQGDTDNISLFSLADAIALGAGFFLPLVRE